MSFEKLLHFRLVKTRIQKILVKIVELVVEMLDLEMLHFVQIRQQLPVVLPLGLQPFLLLLLRMLKVCFRTRANASSPIYCKVAKDGNT